MVAVPGFKLVVDKNRVLLTKSMLKNLGAQVAMAPAHVRFALNVHRPDVVIADYCAWTARYAKLTGKPLISIDNIHSLTRCSHPQEWIAAHQGEAAAAMLVTDMAVPGASYYFVLSFTRATVCQPLTALHLPVVRDSIARQPLSDAGHITVYFNDRADWPAILGVLQRSGRRVRAYGCPGVQAPTAMQNITLCPLSEEGLVRDLASSTAAVSGAGFSFISEAIACKKPLLAVPFSGSFEQILNARYLDREGFGTWTEHLTDGALARFLGNLEPMRAKLKPFPNDRNQGLFEALDRLLDTL